MPSEIELKLDVTSEAAEAIGKSSLLKGQAIFIQQFAIYFDTPERLLSKAGISLRIRRADGRIVQTVKASGGSTAGLFARSEWEQEIDGDGPLLDETTPIRSVVGDAIDEIAPLFEVRIERRVWSVEEFGTSIEMVVDCGEVVAVDRRSAITEIELELKAGDLAELFAFARRLNSVAPVRLGVLTKSERGYRLSEAQPNAFKAERVVLDSDMTSADAFRTIVQACIRQFRLNEDLLVQGRSAEALHQARVALRRMRSAFSIFKPLVCGDESERIQAELRALASTLGEARNLDVLLDRADPGELHDRIALACEGTYDNVESALAAPGTRALMLDLAAWLATGDWLTDAETEEARQKRAREFAVRSLERLRRKVKKDGRDLEHASDEARHEVRKDAKKLRYTAEFFRSLFGRKVERQRYKKFIAGLEELQDKLGALNDVATTPGVLNQLGLGDHPDAASLSSDQKKVLIEAAADAHEDLIDTKRFW